MTIAIANRSIAEPALAEIAIEPVTGLGHLEDDPHHYDPLDDDWDPLWNDAALADPDPDDVEPLIDPDPAHLAWLPF
ncbi:MAG: hypothetical protein AAFX62_16805 [Pseudomonadota bacterium]